MFVEQSIYSVIDVNSISLHLLEIKNNISSIVASNSKILIAQNQNFRIEINEHEYKITDNICFIHEKDTCVIKRDCSKCKFICLDFKLLDSLPSIFNSNRIIKITEEIKFFYSYIHVLYEQKTDNRHILRSIITYLLTLKESHYLKSSVNNCPNLIQAVKEYLHKNIDSKIRIDDIAEHFFISKSELFYIFKKYTNTTIIDYLNQIRIHKSINLLLNTGYSITEISEFVGFDSLPYFSRVFKRFTNISPRDYRKRLEDLQEII